MQDTAQWIIILFWGAIGAAFTHHYKTALACFVGIFAFSMLPPGQLVPNPMSVGVLVFYGAAATMGGYILLQIWRWMGKAGW